MKLKEACCSEEKLWLGPSSQSYGFSSSHVWMWELDYKEGWAPKNWIDAFELWCWRRLLRVPWTAAPQLSYPSLSPSACSNSSPLSRWCHPTISSSVVSFSSCPQSFSASGSFPMSQLFVSGGQSIGVTASASVLPVNIQDWFPLGWTGWISLQSKRLSKVFSNTTVQNHQFFSAQLSL